MSNPASTTSPKLGSIATQVNESEITKNEFSDPEMNRLLEDFYKKPIAMQAARL